MKSILENRPALAKEVNKVAEVAGYLWQKGWAERNGGNITVNITEFVDDEIRRMEPISEVKSIGVTLPYLKGCYFYCKGTNKRMRDLARWPMENGSVIRILDDCANYVISICPYSPDRTDCYDSLREVPSERCGNQSVMEYDSRNEGVLSERSRYHSL